MVNYHIVNSWCNLIISGIGDPLLFSILGSRMAINLKEAGKSEITEDTTNHWQSNSNGTLSDQQFAAPVGPSSG